MTLLATYGGPGGPITATFEAPGIEAAVAAVRQQYRRWYDNAENALDLAPGAPVPETVPGYEPVFVEDLPSSEWSLWLEVFS